MTQCIHGGGKLIEMKYFGTPNSLDGCVDCENLLKKSDHCELISEVFSI